MAHFTNAQGTRISGQNLQVQVGESVEIGLWGFRDFDGQPLNVEVMTGNGQQCSEIASVYQTREQGNTRYYRIRGFRAGEGRIDALTRSLAVWDSLNLKVSGAPSALERLVKGRRGEREPCDVQGRRHSGLSQHSRATATQRRGDQCGVFDSGAISRGAIRHRVPSAGWWRYRIQSRR